ncbi:hypothetical protein FC62_GL001340 [Amylolactobacillus amylotrophicus DSM 20534]|uniref:Uncharacterized protein n=3 Tax=Amylolactobacillus TaxID=2767876 RepID=A0A0R1YIE2_9LACO|nr:MULTISPECIES: hypothetical protein [Amylolactobacillus]APT18114.1 hypothetical protein LA20533_01930 [Amylolactobacillus amylophilus DSM 20533 = JCM 1125]KRK37462.1 hypothetical protein FC62_GL001340 [Amylolactobacillus amylotrophicus DSM 20534]KRM42135.1 hypothetical protein FD40_GL000919 [Amylolactobacillus amylophilus DSM 20533 = JCM 1125]GED80524.1 hypothetical protein LAM01_09970 [Amylolactobacillus amylophilus]
MASTTVFKTELLDRQLREVFDWSDDKTPVRDVLWNYFMEKNSRDTLKTEKEMLPFMKDSDEQIKKFIEENIKH